MQTISRAEFERSLKKIARSRITEIINNSKQTIKTMAKKVAKKKEPSRKVSSKPVKFDLTVSSEHLKNLAIEVESEVLNY